VGISEKDGKLLWTYALPELSGNVHCAVPLGADKVFTLSGWGIGGALLEIRRTGDSFAAVEKYMNKYSFESWVGSTLKVGSRLFSFMGQATCIDLESGAVLFSRGGGGGRTTVTWADDRFYLRGNQGQVLLLEATESEVKTVSKFDTPVGREPAWTFPVVAGGRLYLRDQGELSCHDIRGPKYQEPPPVWSILWTAPWKLHAADPAPPPKPSSDAIFVATPQDVVDKMIELAKITKDDLVYDLGSGDGRIVLTASRNHGCKSVGFEINPGLVWESRFKIKQAKLENLATIEEKDLFMVDLTAASVVTLYLGEPNNAKLLPRLRELKLGSRIVSHAHLLGENGPKPDVTFTMTSKEDGVEHKIHLWTLPLKADPPDVKRK
jgi:hypothetical protein